MQPETRQIVVIGAGIVGICCARWLQRDGHQVTVVDSEPPGEACSFGNAGVFATDSVIPLATPGIVRKAPGLLLRKDSGLDLRWSYLPRIAPWLARFMASARPSRWRPAMQALTQLCAAADAAYQPLLQGSRAAELVKRTGWVTAYLSKRSFSKDQWELDERLRQGVSGRLLDAAALREVIPELSPKVAGGFLFPDCVSCSDPGGLVQRLAADLVSAGGRVEQARVQDLQPRDDAVDVRTDQGAIRADHVVVACGIWSGRFAAALGEPVPLETERGYHAMLEQPDFTPPMPVMSGDHKFVTSPMRAGVRLAGTTELGGLELPANPERPGRMVTLAKRLFPGLRGAHYSEWMGFRPTLPDSLPVIGRSRVAQRVSYAFGHQHLGLTLAGITGRIIADDLAGRSHGVDLEALSISRFARARSPMAGTENTV
ncbi:D-amino-acid dehydrogenase [Natronocella acetinitrilica]|uniref:D-amino-acid dehydrogenase n=1 Tax=Natronocella acetinitrilica TaxID=414046 RepID=A0AAE3G2W9_9GAMM|nr:FAD-binding oxidoreductase [Natronocella acetinitrilica]MCP1673706.1 D-amino-acid dehydrogenase [Natronocella acetinitrilica]